MDSILINNLNALKKRKELYEGYCEYNVELGIKEINSTYSFFYDINGNNEKIYYIKNNDKEYRMCSYYNPKYEAEKWIEKYDKQYTDRRYIVYGLSNGIYMEELLKVTKDDCTIFIYVPNKDEFCYIIENFDISEIIEKCVIVVEGLNDKLFEYFLDNILELEGLYNFDIILSPNYDKVYYSNYASYCRKIKEGIIHSKANQNTTTYYQNELLENMKYWLKSIENEQIAFWDDIIEKIPKDITAIIVSAGPSLEKNIKELKKAKGKAIIVCVNTALQYLEKNGVEVDFGIIIDPAVPKSHFLTDYSQNVILMTDITASKKAVEMNKAIKIPISSVGYEYYGDFFNRFGKEKSTYGSGGSVATSAFSILLNIGIKKIILIGQDLAFGEDGSDHAFGYKDEADIMVEYIDGVNGDKVKTRFDWIFFLRWYEKIIKQLGDDIEIIDATEGGALIKGTKVMTLSDAIEEYCNYDKNFDFEGIVKENIATNEEKMKVFELIKHDYNELKIIKNKIKKGQTIINKLLRLCESKKFDVRSNMKDLEKLSKINKSCENKEVYKLIKMMDLDETLNVLRDVNHFHDDEEEDWKITFSKTKSIYEKTLSITEDLLEKLEDVAKK